MSKTGIPVLMYHAIEDEKHPAGAKDQGEQLYVVSVHNFREQIQYLHNNGYKSYFINELTALDTWPQKAIVLTFDDGHESNYTLALPILQEYGFKAEFFITTGWIGTKHFLTPKQIIGLHKAGMSIGSHSVNHRYLNDLSLEDIKYELSESKIILEGIIAQEITSFSAPGGRIKGSKLVTLIKKYGFLSLHTSLPGLFKKNSTLFEIPRFAIRENTTRKAFSNIINLNFSTIIMIQLTNTLLYWSKKLLGNSNYELIRKTVLANKDS